VAGFVILLGLLAAAAAADSTGSAWPPFLPPRTDFPPEVVSAVQRTWNDRTLSRTVRGRAVRAPLELYAALIDTPDVTAAAARYRGYANDDTRLVGDNLYQADDHDGSRGFYRFLVHEPERHVILSWGEHSSRIVGWIKGDALSVITLTREEDAVDQKLTAYVRIDNVVAAALVRTLVPLFGGLADRKLRQGLLIASRVAQWAVSDPAEFCSWLKDTGLPPDRRAPVESQVPGCQA
jgi:hypothetical protein